MNDNEATTVDAEQAVRNAVRERYAVVMGVWIEPFAKVVKTSDGKTHVLAWLEVSP
jgi:hypothetical protein